MTDTALPIDAVRTVLAKQYHAALAMLREPIEKCPPDLWLDSGPRNAFWQVAYHTLFFAHLYLQPDEASFRPWRDHQGKVQHEDGMTGPADPESPLPLIPDPYTRAQVLEYWSLCDAMVDDALAEMDLLSPECGFHWYKVSKLEHQIVNIRHIQHGAAQLADRIRAALDEGTRWAGTAPLRAPLV